MAVILVTDAIKPFIGFWNRLYLVSMFSLEWGHRQLGWWQLNTLSGVYEAEEHLGLACV